MKSKLFPWLILICLSIFGCTQIIKPANKATVSSLSKKEVEKTYCIIPKKKSLNFLSGSNQNSKSFHQLLKKIKKQRIKLSFIEKSALWLLYQMNVSPDVCSPSSRLQLIVSHKGSKPLYWDFHHPFTKNKKEISYYYPYLDGVEYLLKHFKSKKSLIQLSSLLDRHLPKKFKVTKSLEKTINMKKANLYKSKPFKNVFFKEAEPLKQNESYPKLQFKSLVKKYKKLRKSSKRRKAYGKQKLKKASISRHLFPFKTKSDFSSPPIKCNIDLSLYQHSIFLINSEEVSSNIFGLEEDDSYFIAASSQLLSGPISPLFGTFLIKGKKPQKTPTICLIKNQNKKSNITLISYKGRDPGQHVYNLIQQGVHQSNSLMDLDIFLKGPRKIFLVNPLRVLIEPLDKNEKNLLRFRKKNIPLYPVRNLGHIMAYGQFNIKQQNGFILDKRSLEKLSCLEKNDP